MTPNSAVSHEFDVFNRMRRLSEIGANFSNIQLLLRSLFANGEELNDFHSMYIPCVSFVLSIYESTSLLFLNDRLIFQKFSYKSRRKQRDDAQ